MKKILTKISALIVPLLIFGTLQGCSEKKEPAPEVPEGKILWEFQTDKGILSTPVIYENTVIFGSNDQNLYALDLDTHEEKWRFESSGAINNTPILDGDTIIFSSISAGSTCYALDAKTGTEKWKYKSDKLATDTLGGWDYHSPSPVLYKDTVIFPNKSGNIYGLNKTTGKMEWEYKDSRCSSIVTTPGISEDILCIGDVKGKCFAIDLAKKETIWMKEVGEYVIQSAFAYKDYAYFAGRDAQIIAYDIKDGTRKWTYGEPVGSWFTGNIAVDNDIIYVPGSDNQKVASFNYDTGKDTVSFMGRGNCFATPTISDGKLYFTGGDGYKNLYGAVVGFDISTKKKILLREFEKPIYATPIEKDGVIYVGGIDGKFYAIDTKTE